jgi:hypothetical protein
MDDLSSHEFSFLMVISYPFYGNAKRYDDGALANVELMPTIYPDWEIYIYHDTTVPSNIIDKLTKYKYVNTMQAGTVNNDFLRIVLDPTF